MDTQKAALFDMAPVRFDGKKLALLDQTKLPGEEIYIEIQTKEDMWDAIYHLKVRGAPAIGVAAAYGLYADSLSFSGKDMAGFREHVKKECGIPGKRQADSCQPGLGAEGGCFRS